MGRMVKNVEGLNVSKPLSRELIAAADGGDLQEVARIFELGCAVDSRNAEGETALMRASLSGSVEVVDYLIARGADVEAQSDSGFRAAMVAALYAKADCLRRLMAAGCQIDCCDEYGEATLMFAVAAFRDEDARHASECLAMVLGSGCRLDDRDVRGRTARYIAEEVGAKAAVEMIEAERERRGLALEIGEPGAKARSLRV